MNLFTTDENMLMIEALSKFIEIENMINKNLKTFNKNFLNYVDFDYEIDENEVPCCFICFKIADYISDYLNLITTNETITFQELRKRTGIFHCELVSFAKKETHAFVIKIIDDDVTILQGYGGFEGAFIHKEDKNTWFDKLEKLKVKNKNNKILMRELFNLPSSIYDNIVKSLLVEQLSIKDEILIVHIDRYKN